MSVTVLNIIPRKQIEASQTAQYTASGVKTIIDKFTVTNTSASGVTFSCNLVASGGTASDENNVLDGRNIASGETYTCPELAGQTLEDGGFISTLAGASGSLTISASGREIS